MSGSHTGTKRTNPHPSDDRERRDRPRDWRDAFLDDRSRDHDRDRRDRGRERDYDRHRDRERSRDYRDDRYARDRRDRDYDRDRDRDRDRGRLDYGRSERERGHGGFPSQRHGDRDRRAEPRREPREEGEIESPPRSRSPRRTHMASPRHLSPRESRFSASPRHSDRGRDAPSPRANGRGPRSPRDDGRIGFPSASGNRENERPRGEREPVAKPSEPPAKPAPAEPVAELAPVEELDDEDLEKKREEKRRRREAILAKFRAGEGAKPPLSALSTSLSSEPPSGAQSTVGGVTSETGATPLLRMLGTRSTAETPVGGSPTLASTPLGQNFDLEKHGPAAQPDATTPSTNLLAADYDSKMDNKEDEWEEVETEVEDEDDEMDMFAAFGDEEPVKKKRKIKVRRRKNANGEIVTEKPKAAVLEIVDNVDDVEGYYRITPGELLDDGRYQITVTLGKGMFSAVVKAKVLKAVGQERRQDVVGREVAIKLMRSQESMYVAGRKEAQILKLLNDADPEDKKHIVRMERTFEHKGHLAIVTESMSMNLRDVIKRFGKDVGLNMRAVRAYAHQMLLALSLMRKCNIVHADIKPDNILVSENKAVLKVCDLGTAADVSDGEVTPYLVSRFYRAPEIILGMPYDTAIDMWAIGCTLFELYTGKILFPGRSNNHMLLLMMEVKGKLPHRMIKKASLGAMHFDENNNFLSEEKDRITGAAITKTMVITKATRDLRSRLMPHSSVQAKMKEDELKQLQQFVDLLDKCLMLDPVRRISPREALLHPFVTGH